MTDGKGDNRTELLRQIKDEVVNFKESPLYQERVKNRVFPVIGEGNHYAQIMLVGEAPGRIEARTGRPFSGPAGKILDDLLQDIGIRRQEVYITNVVKDRPAHNRDPFPDEIALYAPFLDRQIEIIQPQIIVALGRHSMKYLMEKFGLPPAQSIPRPAAGIPAAKGGLGISKIRGQVFEAEASYGKIKFLPTFHPATVLYNPEAKKELEEDFQVLKKLQEGAVEK